MNCATSRVHFCPSRSKLGRALRDHWPEYAIEAWALGTFMISAAFFGTLLNHPHSPLTAIIPEGIWRRAAGGLFMAFTAAALTYSPWGKRSGAHMNPATTLTFLFLRKIPWEDAVGYVCAQFVGGLIGMVISDALLGSWLADPAVQYVATVPGTPGVEVAFLAESIIAATLMLTLLTLSNLPRWAPYTGCIAAALVFAFITWESPLSGMSMNPARTLASAVPSGVWTSVWIYFTAPLFGMGVAAVVYRYWRQGRSFACPKWRHDTTQRCIFCGQARQVTSTGNA